jgi:pyruvate dehydrogenase E1 component alpha subunit
MKTYRYSGHSRSDPATYRPAGELDQWLKRDPINLFAEKLVAEGEIEAAGIDDMKREIRAAVEDAVKEVLDAPNPEVSELLSHVDGSAGDDRRWRFWVERPGARLGAV